MASIPGTLHSTAARCPDWDALVFGENRWTYRQLEDAVEQVAAALAVDGLRRGDRALLMSGNSDLFVIAAYAVLRVGAILVPANPRNAPPEIAHLIDDAGVSVVLHAPDFDEVVAAGIAAARSSPRVFAIGAGSRDPDLIELSRNPELPPVPYWPEESDDALLLYTSGTTGRPKGALFDHHRALWTAMNVSGIYGLGQGERILHVAPLYHAAELGGFLWPGTMFAATHVVLPGFDPDVVAEALEAHRISIFFGVPTMYQLLLRVPGLAERDYSAWRVGLYGAAPISGDTVRAMTAALPGVELYQMCGQTEAGPGGIYAGPADVAARPDASGRYALPNTACRIVTPQGEDVEPGGVGEMLLTGETLMKGYWNQPEATAETIRDGWLHTGDLAKLDADGYITLVDRLKDMIITGGQNVYSVEVENALIGHPAVADLAVIGIPHPDFGESILAVVVPADEHEITLEELRAWGAERISRYKLPHVLAVHPIPRNPSGKIQKHLLRAAVLAQTAELEPSAP